MQKLPLLLTTLALMGNSALGLGTMNLLAQASDGAEKAGEYENLIASNMNDARFQMSMIRPRDGSLSLATNTEGTDLYLRRVVMAYYNYEDGVIEAEADKQLDKLGVVEDFGWGTKVLDFQSDALVQSTSFRTGMEDFSVSEEENDDFGWGGMSKKVNLLEQNKTDIVYYAAEYGEREGEGMDAKWSNMEWVRGKIDYRDCAHGVEAKQVDECRVVKNDDGASLRYWNYGIKPADDWHIMTWAEEWREIQEAELTALEERVEALEAEEESDKGTLETLKQDLIKKKIIVTKMEDGSDLVKWRQDLWDRLMKMMPWEEETSTGTGTGTGSGGSGDGNVVGNENVGGGEQNSVINEDTNGNSGASNGVGDAGDFGNSSSNTNEVANNIGENNVANEQSGGLTGVVTRSAGVVAQVNTQEEAQLDRALDSEVNKTEVGQSETGKAQGQKDEEVQVPALGEVKRGWNWWWLVIVAAIIGTIGLWLKRAFGNSERSTK